MEENGSGRPGMLTVAGGRLRSRSPRLVVAVAAGAVLAAGSIALAAPAFADSLRCPKAVAGDTDGDGRTDPVIGVPGKNGSSGSIVLFQGTASGIVGSKSWAMGVAGMPGVNQPGARFGTQVASGDVLGTGCATVAVTAPGDRSEPQGTGVVEQSGSVVVLYGHLGQGLTKSSAQLITPTTLGIAPSNPDLAGDVETLSEPTFGDFNGDGHADLALIDRIADPAGDDSSSVRVVVVPGSATGLDLAGRSTIALTAGSATLAAGNIRGGAFTDLAVALTRGGDAVPSGTPASPHGDLTTHPVVDVFFGAAGGLNTGDPKQVWDRESPGVSGTDKVDGTQSATVAFGDFNGDGHADLAMSVPAQDEVTELFGTSTGLTATAAKVFQPGRSGVQGNASDAPNTFGATLATGDFNGDGDAELVIGGRNGTVEVLPGTHATGLTATGDLSWTQATSGIPGAREKGNQWGAHLLVGWMGHGKGQDLLVSNPIANSGAGTLTELFGSTTRNVGLVKTDAKGIDETTTDVPGTRVKNDRFGGDPIS